MHKTLHPLIPGGKGQRGGFHRRKRQTRLRGKVQGGTARATQAAGDLEQAPTHGMHVSNGAPIKYLRADSGRPLANFC